ncbi:hypothetical protein [Gordonia iterans]
MVTNGSAQADRQEGGNNWLTSRWTNLAGMVIGGVLTSAYVAAIVVALLQVRQPPRLADPAPIPPAATQSSAVQSTDTGATSTLDAGAQTTDENRAPTSAAPAVQPNSSPPEQARGAYDPLQNALLVIGLITPFVTTIVAFYFGAKSVAGPTAELVQSTEKSARDAQKAEAGAIVSQAVATNTDLDTSQKTNLINELKSKGLI